MTHSRPRRRAVLTMAAVVATTAAGLTALAPAAVAAATHPSGAHITSVSSTAVRVAVNKIADSDVTGYILATSTDKKQVTVAYLNNSKYAKYRHEGRSSTNSIAVGGLPYTTAPYYYRVGVTYGRYKNYVAWADAYSAGFGLRPATPTGLTVRNGFGAGDYLQWKAGSSTGARIDQTDTTTGRATAYTIHGTTPIFTPYGLTAGHTYSFRVQALTLATASGASAAVTIKPTARATSVRIMSYNLLGAAYPSPTTYKVYGWAQRVVPAAKLVEQVKPDVLTIQEGDTILGSAGSSHVGNHAYPSSSWKGDWSVPSTSCNTYATVRKPAFRGDKNYQQYWPYRQVDSLCDRVDTDLHARTYARAVDATPLHNGSSNYLIYNTRTMSQLTAAQLGVGPAQCYGSDDPNDAPPGYMTAANTRCGGYFSMESSSKVTTERTAAWAAMQQKSTGVRMLVVSPHASAELCSSWNTRRQQQTRNLIARSKAIAARLHITRIVFAGDFNNYPGRPNVPDVVSPIMRSAGYPDGVENAQTSVNTKYLSGNQYRRSPLELSDHKPGYSNLDHVFVTPGIAVRTFGEALRLNSKGQFADTAIPSDHNPVYADLTLQY